MFPDYPLTELLNYGRFMQLTVPGNYFYGQLDVASVKNI